MRTTHGRDPERAGPEPSDSGRIGSEHLPRSGDVDWPGGRFATILSRPVIGRG
jgi:hypothetical protein